MSPEVHKEERAINLLIDYINEQRKRHGWSIRELASRANISHSGLAKNLRGASVPSTTTVEKVADALGVDRAYMLQLLAQSNSESTPEPIIDPSASYIAKRISHLPEGLREEAVGVLGAMLDMVYKLAEQIEEYEEMKRILNEGVTNHD